MQLVGVLEIKSYEKIKEFLNDEHVGRISSIDVNGLRTKRDGRTSNVRWS